MEQGQEISTLILHGALTVLAIAGSVKLLISTLTTGYNQIITAQGAQIASLQKQASDDKAQCAADIAELKQRVSTCEEKWKAHEATQTKTPIVVDRRVTEPTIVELKHD